MYDHIRNVLPSIIKEINLKIRACEENIAQLGDPVPIDNKQKLEQIWNDVSIFIEKFKSNVRGEFEEIRQAGKEEKEEKILAAAQISILFNDLFKEYLSGYQASKTYSDKEMAKVINMYMGNTLPGFINVDCFMALVSPIMEKVRPPAEELLDQVALILKNTGLFFI